MPAILIPSPATQQEVRCDSFIGRNNLDVQILPADTGAELIAKVIAKYSIILDRMLEPQDASGQKVGDRVRADKPAAIDIAASIFRTYTRADGVTFTGMDFLLAMEAVVDAHKADGLLPEPTPPEIAL